MKNITLAITLLSTLFLMSASKQMIGTKKGDVAPEIVQNGVDGKPIKLSDYQGQMVLIDFWASWCRPCRMQNPAVVQTYQKFKNAQFTTGKGFTVFSVSLDEKKDSWLAAIQADRLEWPAHVSDLKGWNNAASRKYGVGSIPTTYLIDGKGVIIGKNLTHQELEYELAKRKVNGK